MIAIDTNVLVRLLVDDEPEQSRRARRLFERDSIWIGSTVLLETAWVLEAVYERTQDEITASLRAVLGLPNVITETPTAIASALDAVDTGLDFADALHVFCASPEVEAFVTFDRRLHRRAARLRPMLLA